MKRELIASIKRSRDSNMTSSIDFKHIVVVLFQEIEILFFFFKVNGPIILRFSQTK